METVHPRVASLREHHDLTLKGGIQENIREGAVVYVHEEHQPRGHWKMGKVESVMEGTDGNIRGATVKVIRYHKGEANIPESSVESFIPIRGF